MRRVSLRSRAPVQGNGEGNGKGPVSLAGKAVFIVNQGAYKGAYKRAYAHNIMDAMEKGGVIRSDGVIVAWQIHAGMASASINFRQ